MKLQMQPRATRNIKSVRVKYEAESSYLKLQWDNAMRATLSLILEYPGGFREVKPGVRRVLVSGFPYVIYYAPHGRVLKVLRILHMRREIVD